MLLKPADEHGPAERSALLRAATWLWMQQHQAWGLDNPCPDFLRAKAPIPRQGVSSRHPKHSCPTCGTEGLWFNLLRRQIGRLTLNMLHSSPVLSCKYRVEWCRCSPGQLPAPLHSTGVALKKCSITPETIQKMFYHSRNTFTWWGSPVAFCLCELVE